MCPGMAGVRTLECWDLGVEVADKEMQCVFSILPAAVISSKLESVSSLPAV